MVAASLKRAFFNWDMGGLEMPPKLELMAALDLKSAHGPDHSGRGVPILELHSKSHRPLSGLGLWCPAPGPAASQEPRFKALLSEMLCLHICICPRPSHGSWPLSTSRAVFLSTSMAAGGQLQLIKGGCGDTQHGYRVPSSGQSGGVLAWLRECSITQRETMLSESTAQGALRCSLWDSW